MTQPVTITVFFSYVGSVDNVLNFQFVIRDAHEMFALKALGKKCPNICVVRLGDWEGHSVGKIIPL